MDYHEALRFWYSRIDYERADPKPGDLKLDRIRALLDLLGNPHDRLRIVHVAGSKGKGSCAAMLERVLRSAGHRTGLFTSPHLVRVEERIQVDAVPVSAEELAAALTDVRDAVTKLDGATPPGEPRVTFFEVGTAVGLLHFLRRRVDAAVVEVGLGGRFDSTNVCRPVLSVITSISIDHTRQLGDKLASIAREKAGIVKRGRPTVSGATAPEARAVIKRVCRERRSPLTQLGVDFRYDAEPGRVTADATRPARVRARSGDGRATEWMELSLLGEHQAANAAVVVACVERLRAEGWHVPDRAVAEGLATVEWPARLEVVGRRPLVVLDCAHNVASAETVVKSLRASFPPGRRLLVFACSNDKDVPGIVGVLAPHFAHAYLTRYGNNPRAVPPEQLAEQWRRAGRPCSACSTSAEAWRAARGAAGPDDLICVTGSVFLAGELRPMLLGESRHTCGR